ncbi:unnamed protein product [Chrysoparadoxa australica]
MVLYMVGLGLGNERDITLRGKKSCSRHSLFAHTLKSATLFSGLDAVKECTKVYLEQYTSILGVDKDRLEKLYGREVTYADRECVESQAESIYGEAKESNVAFLVVGDPLCATTHTDLIIRARELGIQVEVIHNASVMGAAASCGLQLYTFGQTISIPLWDKEMGWTPSSFYEKIAYNRRGGMHTLCLLDIKVKEPDFKEMAQGRVRYLPPRYMTIGEALTQLLEVEEQTKGGAYTPDTMAVGMARLGQESQVIIAGTMKELSGADFGGPLHSLVIAGELHPLEEEMMEMFAYKPNKDTS